MNTFLPYPSFEESAKVLDNKRLNKQIVECDQILQAMRFWADRQCFGYFTNRKGIRCEGRIGWEFHPCFKMWNETFLGGRQCLTNYRNACVYEWHRRGYTSHTEVEVTTAPWSIENAWWWGNEEFHAAHRSNLTRKDAAWYSQFWSEKPMEGYLWPTTFPKVWIDQRKLEIL